MENNNNYTKQLEEQVNRMEEQASLTDTEINSLKENLQTLIDPLRIFFDKIFSYASRLERFNNSLLSSNRQLIISCENDIKESCLLILGYYNDSTDAIKQLEDIASIIDNHHSYNKFNKTNFYTKNLSAHKETIKNCIKEPNAF